MLEHRFAKLVAFATFLLLVIGGTVNPTGSSLACPEPTFVCNGELFPPMVGGVLYEHGHRLAAQTVGLLQIILTYLLIRRRPHLTWLAWALGGMVATQALLGALTVYYKLPWFVSTAHLLLAMTYFATLLYTAFVTRPQPSVVELAKHERQREELGAAKTWIAIAIGAVFVQLLLGALVRHLGAALVCLGMPTCTISGEWFPDTSVQQLHMIHRGFGVVVGVVTIVAAVRVYRAARSWPGMRLLAIGGVVLVLAQITLGIVTVLTMRSVPVAVAHFAGAAGLWALWTSAWWWARSRRVTAVTAENLEAVLPTARAVPT